ncbi:MAG: tRNA (N(6)-L-threonylcarbamoyladenosine(37)-C(2))-methylthiotransferase MtaB [Lentimicrobiaceae bacterium]|nr:tRNA (N(6)-L-threonylcarbamoyladenosine(37)-C(2))-methylthiotransferase MtaB [Lentimicrobiaceae bacterium]
MEKESRNKSVYIKTLGCKINFSESAAMEQLLTKEGYIISAKDGNADVFIVNSCAVTENAEKKCRQYIHQIKKNYPQAKIVLVGCFSALKNVQSIENEVDMMFGSSDKMNVVQGINRLFCDAVSVEKTNDDNAFFSSYSLSERTRSFLKIQDGCDYFCTYCTVAYARGKSRSDTIENVIVNARKIVENDIKEIVLTGVNIGDFKTKKGEDFLDLLKVLAQVENLKRLRISSIEPNLLTREIIDFAAVTEMILPHFHIPLQSGCNDILAKMRRRYRRELFAETVYYIKEKMPHACIAADVIVGFPGETQEQFLETYNFIKSLPVSMLHVFPYSKRPDTPAADMPNHLTNTCKNERAKRLIQLSEEKKKTFYHENSGKIFQALIESKNENGFLQGFTENYIRIKLPYNKKYINEIVRVKLQAVGELPLEVL